jgi:hypothetical protein
MMDCCLGAPPFKRLVVEVPRDVAGIAGPGTSGVSGWCKWFAFSVDDSAFSSGIQIYISSGGLGVRCVEKLECLTCDMSGGAGLRDQLRRRRTYDVVRPEPGTAVGSRRDGI